MPMNHFSPNLPETIWWTQVTQPQPIMEPAPNTPSSKHKPLIPHHHHPLVSLNSYHSQHSPPMFPTRSTTPFNFNLNQDTEDDEDEEVEEVAAEEEEEEVIIGAERQPMFEKPLTPSDVGKLNRLVIPKQHAEKYFPLGGDSGEKGLLLSFEDECGKCWRFRYSYWNSSQSYVLTKGWSRFVKEKRLDAGDVVLFQRDRSDADRFFIGWRRRAGPAQDNPAAAPPVAVHTNTGNTSVGWTRVFYSAHAYPSHPHAPPLPYQPDCLHAGILFTLTPPLLFSFLYFTFHFKRIKLKKMFSYHYYH